MHKIIMDSRNKEIDNCKVGKDIEDLNIDEIVLKRKLGPEKGNKLESKWIGPYRIKHKGKLGNYIICDWNNKAYSVNRKDLMKLDDNCDDLYYEGKSEKEGVWSKTTETD
ncbi:hypothetical protein COBT_004108 [Conglomerata obtusa]